MKYAQPIWRFIFGATLMLGAGYLLLPVLGETVLTVQTLVGIVLVSVGSSVLASVL